MNACTVVFVASGSIGGAEKVKGWEEGRTGKGRRGSQGRAGERREGEGKREGEGMGSHFLDQVYVCARYTQSPSSVNRVYDTKARRTPKTTEQNRIVRTTW